MAGQASWRLSGYSAYGGPRRDRRNYSVNIFFHTSLLHLPMVVPSSVRPLLVCLHDNSLPALRPMCIESEIPKNRIETLVQSCFKLKRAYITHQCARDGTRVAMLDRDLFGRGPIHLFGTRPKKTTYDSVLTIYFSFTAVITQRLRFERWRPTGSAGSKWGPGSVRLLRSGEASSANRASTPSRRFRTCPSQIPRAAQTQTIIPMT